MPQQNPSGISPRLFETTWQPPEVRSTQVTNVITTAKLTASGSWTCNQAIPPFDECIVRQITYSTAAPAPTVSVITSNIGTIGAFVAVYNYVSTPQTVIQNRGAGSQLTFQISTPGEPELLGTIAIQLDFIKYKRS